MSEFAQPAICVNIGRRERQRRLAVGIGMCALGIGLAVALIGVGIPHWWRLGLFVPFWLGVLGIVQALRSTCVVLAAQGVRNLDTKEEPIHDQVLREQLRRRARIIHFTSAAVAATLTALCVVW